METARQKASNLATQLQQDGLSETLKNEDEKLVLKTDQVLETYQFWGYNPPYTIPWLRRNEIWIPLTEPQVQHLLKKQELGKEDPPAGSN